MRSRFAEPTRERRLPMCGAVWVVAVLFAMAGLPVEPASAQIKVERQRDEVVIKRAGKRAQRLARGSETGRTKWAVVDEAGNTFPIAGYASSNSEPPGGAMTMATTGGRDSGGEGPIIVVGGYQNDASTTGRDSGGEDPIIVVGGYQAALQHLEDEYGAEVQYDQLLKADIISLPGFEDPVGAFFDIIVSDSVYGYPLIHFFRMLEVASVGLSDAGYLPVPPARPGRGFPSDPFFPLQWNVDATRLAQAAWHPFTPKLNRPVRIGIIDSGINERDRDVAGLDGVEAVRHVPIAPTTGYALQHGLAVTTLLADAANDGDGVVGLIGGWNESECRRGQSSLSDRMRVEIYSYNVGDWGPVSVEVSRAIYQSIEDGVDVINLSLRTAESPSITEAIQAALDANIIVVAAAGNYDATARQKPTSFPANLEGVISVTSADQSRRLSKTAADTGYDIIAPGEDIVVGGTENTWYRGSGTSFAAPHVVATVALLRAAKPDLTPAEARDVLRASSARLAGLGRYKQRNEGGFLDAFAALNNVLPPQERVRTVRVPRYCGGGGLFDMIEPLFADLTASELPEEVELTGNSPNPFSSSTTIRYALPEAQHVRLAVYNLLGQEVRVLVDGLVEAGYHEADVQARDLPSGVYIYRLETADGSFSNRMVLAR